MKIGMGLPQMGKHASPANIKMVAQEGERMGLESLWVLERLLRPTHALQPYGTMDPWPEGFRNVFDPIETLTYAAAVTQRIKLGTSVVDALYHSPVVLGKRLATLDQLSGGRLIACLGQGWSHDEFAVVNVSPKRKGAGFEEFLLALLAVWGPDPVKFDGRFYRIPESEIGPKPVQQPRPPVLIGGFAPASVQRTARLGLGLNPVAFDAQMLTRLLESFRTAAVQAGRDPAKLPVMVRANVHISDMPAEGQRHMFNGSIAQVVEDAQRVAELGVDQLFLDFYSTEVPPEQQLRYVDQVRAAVPTARSPAAC